MPAPCETCPFTDSEGGTRQREALARGRFASIKRDLLKGNHFFCHKTVHYDDQPDDEDDSDAYYPKGDELLCAGGTKWQNDHGVDSQLQRVMERLDYFREQREAKAEPTA